jgi:hypothetical protein
VLCGNLLAALKGKSNVAATAAGPADACASYEGYDERSSKEMKSQSDNNAKEIHDAGIANKEGRRGPSNGRRAAAWLSGTATGATTGSAGRSRSRT